MGKLANRQHNDLADAIENGIIPAKKDRQYEVEALQDRHRLIIRMSAAGLKNVAIARELGISDQNVSDVLNSRLAVAERARLMKMAEGDFLAVQEKVLELGGRALIFLEEDFENEDTPRSERRKLALEFLDRAGHTAPKQVNIQQTTALLTYDDILKVKEKIKEEQAETVDYVTVEEANG